jgi:ribosome maturation factor RimP
MRQLIEQIVNNVLSNKGVELVDIDLLPSGKHPVVRIYLDKPGGITVGECAVINRELSVHFLVEASIPDNMVIEVSSPGLDRPLKTQRDFERNMGRDLEVFYRSGERQLDKTGKLTAVASGAITLLTIQGELALNLSDIVKAKQHINF